MSEESKEGTAYCKPNKSKRNEEHTHIDVIRGRRNQRGCPRHTFQVDHGECARMCDGCCKDPHRCHGEIVECKREKSETRGPLHLQG